MLGMNSYFLSDQLRAKHFYFRFYTGSPFSQRGYEIGTNTFSSF